MERIKTHYDEMERDRLIAEVEAEQAMRVARHDLMWENIKTVMWQFLIVGTAGLGIAGSVVLFFGNPSFC